LFTAAGAHVSKPDSAVYKKKRAERTVDSDEEETKQEAKRIRCGILRFVCLLFFSLILLYFILIEDVIKLNEKQ
jgi:hypothetical protein